ncbi:hypothetical protein FRY98_13245 [Paenibacillus faecis]|uniref:F0F1-type ATP synthase n=1 Tax=Paenibacillus faecis TaxID=862114 RepID=A0A5D0CUM3_9BACL|nr:hypothetical protein [Paenibacillus faecis]TYA13599.1 hypothetical protein FRY98_13245 [Paenibacillus faecis]
MKITDWAVIFVLLACPALYMLQWDAVQLREANRLQLKYTAALRTAAQDAGSRLGQNELQRYEAGYGSSKFMRADKEAALSAMLDTLLLNLGEHEDALSRDLLMTYIPAVIVIDYDGYHIYAVQEKEGEDGSVLARHHWLPKKSYVHRDAEGNMIYFTLDDQITVIDSASGEVHRGLREELGSALSVKLLQQKEAFEDVRRSAIVSSIQEDLSRVIDNHNAFVRKLGFNYIFTLPTISMEAWNNSIDDVGILVFLQGLPVGGKHYNNYALGGGRVLRQRPVYGWSDPNTGIRYAGHRHCFGGPGTERAEIFASPKDAAAKGYFEARCPLQGP